MKKILLGLAITLTITLTYTLTGCRNLPPITPTLTTEQKLVGKWTVKNAIGDYTTQGNNHKDTTYFTAADYYDFRADGTITMFMEGVAYTGNWKVTNGKLKFTNTNYMEYASFDLPILTTTNLQIYLKEVTNITSLEQKLNLTK
ncbi:MAG: hypothetical protein H7289_11955 [Mucilaginibacter sp.]|nr:hypothetical protein [Mucilaginibacter sp.]